MKQLCYSMVATGLILLAGCAARETPTTVAVVPDSLKLAPKETLTGSRLVKPTTERVVKAVGNQEYNQENLHKGIANTVADKSN